MKDYAQDIWKMANDLRGNTHASAYKDYILGFIVYRYLSAKQAEYLSPYLNVDKKAGESEEQLQIKFNKAYLKYENYESCLTLVLDKYGYAIKPEDTWISIINKAKNRDLTLDDLEKVFIHFNENLGKINNNKAYNYYKGLFSGINLSNTGSPEKMASALAQVALKIDSIDIYGKEGHDILGDIYEALIAKFASGTNAGEFYTPHRVSKLLSRLTTIDIKEERSLDIMDFAMGSGALLLTYADAVPGGHKKGTIHFYGQEIITETYNLARMNLMMHDVEYKHTTLRNGDTLGKDWPENKKMDIISANPPYSENWDNKANRDQDPRFSSYDIAPKSYADYAFLLHGLYHLKDDGTMGIVLPHGVLFRSGRESNIRKKLLKQNMIDAIIGLPENLFYSAKIPTVIMILKKNKRNNDVMFIDASSEFKKVKKRNELTEENISKIIQTYKDRKNVEKYSHVASYEEIKANDFNLNIPRYVDTFEPEPDINLDEVQNDISAIDQNIKQEKKRFDDMNADLVETDVNTNEN